MSLRFHANWDYRAYLEKYDFQQKLIFQFWDIHWIRGIKMSHGVVLDPDFESHLALHTNEANLNWYFLQLVLKNVTFYEQHQT